MASTTGSSRGPCIIVRCLALACSPCSWNGIACVRARRGRVLDAELAKAFPIRSSRRRQRSETVRKARGTQSNERDAQIDWSRARVVGRGTKAGRRYDLKTLRAALGRTQAEVADAARMAQGDVSRLEGREDVKLSTLARYAVALGGSVEVAVVVNGRRYVLDLTLDGDDAASRAG